MAVLVTLQLPGEDTALERTFDELPDARYEMENTLTAGFPGFWVSGEERAALEGAFDVDPTVESYSLITAGDGRLLYDFEFGTSMYDVLLQLFRDRAAIFAMTGTGGTWTLRLRFPERSHLQQSHDQLKSEGVDVEVLKITRTTDTGNTRLELTEAQHRTLELAVERGYFEVPRRITMEELAAELGVSHQALSERLRRAYRTLAITTLSVYGSGADVETETAN
ncbi:helix-turn-helix domain-containing protein [Natrononativus amylolyticus]|uniref:helix-turn-helix domain-containing protein n=1 Tax=Natrononativus amylolyticus TaxID=2963434 RepID=UPI0020CBD672|nr:helix-turn-helix domain-containing protein [Natrononativus amylolyticus]